MIYRILPLCEGCVDAVRTVHMGLLTKRKSMIARAGYMLIQVMNDYKWGWPEWSAATRPTLKAYEGVRILWFLCWV